MLERPPVPDLAYVAFADPSGGSKDAFTLAIAHQEDGRAVLDVVREVRPPFNPDSVVGEFVKALMVFGVDRVVGDRYAGEWVVSAFAGHGIGTRLSPMA